MVVLIIYFVVSQYRKTKHWYQVLNKYDEWYKVSIISAVTQSKQFTWCTLLKTQVSLSSLKEFTDTIILTCSQKPRHLHRPLERRKVNYRLVILLVLTIETMHIIYFVNCSMNTLKTGQINYKKEPETPTLHGTYQIPWSLAIGVLFIRTFISCWLTDPFLSLAMYTCTYH